MGRLTTHILDTSSGTPAAGVAWSLYRVDSFETPIRDGLTNSDGRSEGAILEGEAFKPGIYELRFAIGDYFRSRGITLPEPAFLDVIVIRFGIHDAEGHYHVPLLASPFGYSTYRGS